MLPKLFHFPVNAKIFSLPFFLIKRSPSHKEWPYSPLGGTSSRPGALSRLPDGVGGSAPVTCTLFKDLATMALLDYILDNWLLLAALAIHAMSWVLGSEVIMHGRTSQGQHHHQ